MLPSLSDVFSRKNAENRKKKRLKGAGSPALRAKSYTSAKGPRHELKKGEGQSTFFVGGFGTGGDKLSRKKKKEKRRKGGNGVMAVQKRVDGEGKTPNKKRRKNGN